MDNSAAKNRNGLGYVGLSLSLQFAHSGVQVLALDIDPDKAERTQPGPELHQACSF
jgi:UDP-N-acetyl-D-mannosaminuronate dehydrogenase